MRSVTEDTECQRKKLSRRIQELEDDQNIIVQKNIKNVLDDEITRRLISEKKKPESLFFASKTAVPVFTFS